MIDIIKLNDFQALWDLSEKQILKTVKKVGSSGWYILGKEVLEFEKKLLYFFPGLKYCAGCGNGLDAIEIGLRTLGVKNGNIVLTTPLTAFATTLAIIRAGGVPAFVDIDESGLINLDLADEFFHNNPDVRYFVPVHLYGHSLDLDHLRYLKNKYRLKIVEDCAQSIMATSHGKSVGSVGQVACTSFYPTKNLGCLGDGGAILTSMLTIYNQAKALRDYGQTGKYRHSLLGLNSRLDELQAAIMKDCFLPNLSEATVKRQQVANFYINNIKNKRIVVPQKPRNSKSVYHLFPILVNGNREGLREHLKNNGIESGIHYPILITDQKALIDYPHFIYGNLKIAKKFVNAEISLPINSTMSDKEALRVVKACNNW